MEIHLENYYDCNPRCGQNGKTYTVTNIRKVTCLKCLSLVCKDVRKAYDKAHLLMCPFQRRCGD